MLATFLPDIASAFDYAVRLGVGQGPFDLLSVFALSALSLVTVR